MAKSRTEPTPTSEGYPPLAAPLPPVPAPPPPAPTTDAPLSGLDALKARIETTRTALLPGASNHCRDCFQRGRDAAIKAILGE